jgi:hypothetical protein
MFFHGTLLRPSFGLGLRDSRTPPAHDLLVDHVVGASAGLVRKGRRSG